MAVLEVVELVVTAPQILAAEAEEAVPAFLLVMVAEVVLVLSLFAT
jgi:hypothetical protein